MEKNIYKKVENLVDNEYVKERLVFYSSYLLCYENLKHKIMNDVINFFCILNIKDGKVTISETKHWKEIKKRKINEKSNTFLSVMLWFVENGAITMAEYDEIVKIRNDRNQISHELVKLLYEDSNKAIFEENFIKCINIFTKIEKWWIFNIEMPTSTEKFDSDVTMDDVVPGNNILLDMILQNLYGENEYKNILNKIKELDKF